MTHLGSHGVRSSSLCCLDLSHNRLTSLAGLQWLPHLRQLDVLDNQLTSLEGLQVQSFLDRTIVFVPQEKLSVLT